MARSMVNFFRRILHEPTLQLAEQHPIGYLCSLKMLINMKETQQISSIWQGSKINVEVLIEVTISMENNSQLQTEDARENTMIMQLLQQALRTVKEAVAEFCCTCKESETEILQQSMSVRSRFHYDIDLETLKKLMKELKRYIFTAPWMLPSSTLALKALPTVECRVICNQPSDNLTDLCFEHSVMPSQFVNQNICHTEEPQNKLELYLSYLLSTVLKNDKTVQCLVQTNVCHEILGLHKVYVGAIIFCDKEDNPTSKRTPTLKQQGNSFGFFEPEKQETKRGEQQNESESKRTSGLFLVSNALKHEENLYERVQHFTVFSARIPDGQQTEDSEGLTTTDLAQEIGDSW